MNSDLKSNWPIWLVASVVFANGLLSVVAMLVVRFKEPAKLFSAPIPFGPADAIWLAHKHKRR
jgi:hypothetical protein